MCSQFCKFDGTLGKLERVYEEDRVWEWYHAINKLILFCIYTAEASLRINMWPSRLLMAHIQYTEKRSIFFHLNVELENRETERENYKKRLLFILNHSVKNPYHHFLSLTRWQLPQIGLRIQENTAITAAWILPLAEFSLIFNMLLPAKFFVWERINTESKQVYIFNIQSPTQTKTTDMQIKQKQHIQSMTVKSNHITNICI